MLLWEEWEKAVKPQSRPIPVIPNTGWVPRDYFPDLSSAKAIAIDTETYDPELNEAGPGWARGRGHIVGMSVATDDGFKAYYPMRHTVQPEHNLDPQKVLTWASEQLGRPHQVKVGANLIYDIGWLRQEGVIVRGKKMDIQFAEALIDEFARYSLDVIANKYIGEGKDSGLMYQWLADAYGGDPGQKQRANIYRCPPCLVGAYAESDAVLPLQIIQKQWPILQREGLLDVFNLECRLIDVLVAMRFQAVRVDLDKAEQARERLIAIEKQTVSEIERICGFGINVNSSSSIAKAFDSFELPYNRSASGNPSFTADFLKSVEHPLAKLIIKARGVHKARSTFIENYILHKNVNGRLYGPFHPMKGDNGGTESGRFASSNPNLQNLPARDPEIGPLIRGCFVPDHDHKAWRAMDYSSIEYRFLAHYAIGEGSDHVRSVFNNDPTADYHQIVCDLINSATGIGIKRKRTKTINFGLIYGMGVDKLALSLGMDKEEAKELIDIYFQHVPYAKSTLEHYSGLAGREGYIATILGRRSRFNMFVPSRRGGRDSMPLPYDEAVRAWGHRIERVGLHKAVNRKLQGSSADLIKTAMADCYEAGLFDDLMPCLTVHDELDWSDPCEPWSDERFKEIRHIMETAIPGIKVPIVVATDRGADWGSAVEVSYDDLKTPVE